MQQEHYNYNLATNFVAGKGELSVLFCGDAAPVPNHANGPAVYDYYLIHTVMSGKGKFRLNDLNYECTRGDSFVIFPGELYHYVADQQDPWQYRWVAFRGHHGLALLASLGITPDNPIVPCSNLRRIIQLYRRLAQCLSSDRHSTVIDIEAGGWLRTLLATLGEANAGGMGDGRSSMKENEQMMEKAAAMLSMRLDQPFSVEKLADLFGYHRTHLSKLFKATIGLSPMQYLLKLRMERAQALLASTNLPIEHVASSVGYPDPLYFSKQFRRSSGFSPTEYRHLSQISSRTMSSSDLLASSYNRAATSIPLEREYQ